MNIQYNTSFRLPRIGLLVTVLLAILNVPAWSQKAADEAIPPPVPWLRMLPADQPAPASPPQAALPDDARAVVERFDKEDAELRQQFEKESQRQRAQAVERLERLADSYAAGGLVNEAAAVRKAIERIKSTELPADGAAGVLPDPGNLTGFRNRIGRTFAFRVTGSLDGVVWGTDLYTDDSSLAAAAVHAGLVKPGETAVVNVRIADAADSYEGSSRNGVTSSDYGHWFGSYRLAGGNAAAAGPAVPGLDPAPALASLRGKAGEVLYISLTGSTTGIVWGTDVYTDDSSPAAAAVHAGVLKDGQRGIVKITIAPAQETYTGSTRNGVESLNYGDWGGSFRIERVPEGFAPPKIYRWSAPVRRNGNFDVLER